MKQVFSKQPNSSRVAELSGQPMPHTSPDIENLGDLFAMHRPRLRRLVDLRLDGRLQGRIDPSDVLQEAYLDATRRAEDYAANPTMPPYLWLRFLTLQRLTALHRFHLGTRKRNAGQERSIFQRSHPNASTEILARELTAGLASPSHAAIQAELQDRLKLLLDGLEPLDREVLALRHFEELSNQEAAEILGISTAAASKRYIRALERMKTALGQTDAC